MIFFKENDEDIFNEVKSYIGGKTVKKAYIIFIK